MICLSSSRLTLVGICLLVLPVAAQADADLETRARQILARHCHRCHGQDGTLEGGFNYVLDRDKLVARKKVLPGRAAESPLFQRIANGKMPPPDVSPRPTPAEVALLQEWINRGAQGEVKTRAKGLPPEQIPGLLLADLDKMDRRSRRFVRYLSLVELARAGLGEDELQTYRNAVAKLLNSLSWHPRIALPVAIDADRLLFRFDLRDFLWDTTLWNRLLVEYPYGLVSDTAVERAVVVATQTRLPWVRADWFVATASRPPLYHDLLQLPVTLGELEAQLRVNVAVNVQQERVARAGFLGSGIARNNRLLERHDAAHGAYWRSYDFDAVPQNLGERGLLLPDRRNLFAYPLGPASLGFVGRGAGGEGFQHAGGEAIFNLPNGLQGYLLVNANNQRVDRAPTALVSDPKRPDRAVEAGISCIGCHVGGIHPKDDQIREHVDKNPRAFTRNDAELVRALHVPVDRMRALMEEDAERFRKALAKTGNKVSAYEPVLTLTLRYEGDVDLPSAAAELGLTAEELVARLKRASRSGRDLGALAVTGGTVPRQVWVQSFADAVRELGLGTPLNPVQAGALLTDNTGEVDPLEAQSHPANGAAFTPDGRLALIAANDRSVRIHDIDARRERRRGIGHTASVWSIAASPDSRLALSGSADGTVRLWDLAQGRELRRFDGHQGVVSAVAFSPDGNIAFSGSADGTGSLWDLKNGQLLLTWEESPRHITGGSFSPDGRWLLVCVGNMLVLRDCKTGKEMRRFTGHKDWVSCAQFSPEGRQILSGSDDRTIDLWDVASRKLVRVFQGHTGSVKCVCWAADGRTFLSASSDRTLRQWDVATGKELRRREHPEVPVAIALGPKGERVYSVTREAQVLTWDPERP